MGEGGRAAGGMELLGEGRRTLYPIHTPPKRSGEGSDKEKGATGGGNQPRDGQHFFWDQRNADTIGKGEQQEEGSDRRSSRWKGGAHLADVHNADTIRGRERHWEGSDSWRGASGGIVAHTFLDPHDAATIGRGGRQGERGNRGREATRAKVAHTFWDPHVADTIG